MTTATIPAVAIPTRSRRLVRTGAIAGVTAAVLNELVLAVAKGIDVPMAVDGSEFPVGGFAQMTLLCTAVGVGLAALFARKAAWPRKAFTRTTVILTAVSFVPSFLLGADAATTVVLLVSHVVAAAVVIPALAARLHD